jgi:hypothetical protein
MASRAVSGKKEGQTESQRDGLGRPLAAELASFQIVELDSREHRH